MKPKRCLICQSKNISFFAKKSIYYYFQCKSCKSIFTYPSPSTAELDKYYETTFDYEDGKLNEQTIRNRANRIKNKLASFIGKNKSLCDVGSGYGFFLDQVKDYYPNSIGIEPSKILAKDSQSRFGLSIFPTSLNTFVRKYPGKRFDIVTCIHVIEHVPHPSVFIEELKKLLNPNGIIFIETPNADSHLLYAEKENYTFLLAPEHPWLLSKKAFSFFFSESHFRISISTYSYPQHCMGIAKAMIKKMQSQGNYTVTHTRSPSVQSINNRFRTFILLRKKITFFIFDLLLSKLTLPLINIHHKGSILELYINKKK